MSKKKIRSVKVKKGIAVVDVDNQRIVEIVGVWTAGDLKKLFTKLKKGKK